MKNRWDAEGRADVTHDRARLVNETTTTRQKLKNMAKECLVS